MKSAICLTSKVIILVFSMLAGADGAENIVFPDHPSIKNVKTVFGAKGDGVSDDTEALNRGFKTLNGLIYLPNGTYRVTNTIMGPGGSTGGPWVYGQSRDGVVIKLDDDASGFTDSMTARAVIAGTSAAFSADQFMRQWHNFTVDAGNNRGAIGIRFYSNNSGILNNVRIVGAGKYGLDMGWLGMNGPLLIQNVEIDGFATGVYTYSALNSQTMVDITIRNCLRQGVYNHGQVLSIENITVENTPIALYCMGMICVINGRFSGNDTSQPAIFNGWHLYARNIVTTGFSRAIQSSNGGVAEASVDEFTSEPVVGAFPEFRPSSLHLPIKKTPPLDWEQDLSKWVNVQDHGATDGGRDDDSRGIQAAIDSAAAAGKTTVFIPNGTYSLVTQIRVHGSVRHIIGLGFARLLPFSSTNPQGFVLAEDAAPVVRFENIYSLAPSIVGRLRTVTSNNTSALVIDNCDGWTIKAAGSGDVFINNTCALLEITNPGARVWARQWNTEGHGGKADSDNQGGFLWILGLKTESGVVKISTTNGGLTELLGAHIYNTHTDAKTQPLFVVKDSWASFAVVREICYHNVRYTVHVGETRQGVTRNFFDTDRTFTLVSAADPGFTPPSIGILPRPGKAQRPALAGQIRDGIFDIRGRMVSRAGATTGASKAPAGLYIVTTRSGRIRLAPSLTR